MSNPISINSLHNNILFKILKEASSIHGLNGLDFIRICKQWRKAYTEGLNGERKNLKMPQEKINAIKEFNIKNCGTHFREEFTHVEKINNLIERINSVYDSDLFTKPLQESMQELECSNEKIFHPIRDENGTDISFNAVIPFLKFRFLRRAVSPIFERYGFRIQKNATADQFQSQFLGLYHRLIEILKIDRAYNGMWANGLPSEIKDNIFSYLKQSETTVCKNWYNFHHCNYQRKWKLLRDGENTLESLAQAMKGFNEAFPEASGIDLFRKFFSCYLWGNQSGLNRVVGRTLSEKMLLIFQSSKDNDLTDLYSSISKQPIMLNRMDNANQIREWISLEKNQEKLQKVTQLYLSLGKVRNLPPEIIHCSAITSLVAEGAFRVETSEELSIWPPRCYVETLPSEIGNLSKLQNLLLRGLGLRSLPFEFGNLNQLKILDLSYNQLTTFPIEITNLTQLEELNLSENKLELLSSEIDKLIHLKVLLLEFNNLSTLPPEIGKLKNLKLALTNNPRLNHIVEYKKLHRTSSLTSDGSKIKLISEIKNKSKAYAPVSTLGMVCILAEIYKTSLICASDMQGSTEIEGQYMQEWLKEEFYKLSENNKNLIYHMVWIEAQSPEGDAQWGEKHVFDDKVIFANAVQDTIKAKLKVLSEFKQNQVYSINYKLAGFPETDDFDWGKNNAEENLSRLADAVEFIS